MSNPKIGKRCKFMRELYESTNDRSTKLLRFILNKMYNSNKFGIQKGITQGKKIAYKEIFDKFDEYSCIKNDKWYLDFKNKKLLTQKKS